MLAFAVVFVAGTVITAIGVAGDGSTRAAELPDRPTPAATATETPDTPVTGPTATGPTVTGPTATGPTVTGPTGGVLPPGDLVFTTTASSNVSNVNCVASLFFTWEIDPSTAPPGRDAVIELEGPRGSRRYDATLRGTTVELTLEEAFSGSHVEWTASLLTVGGQEVIDTPLFVSVDDPTC
jgi:hypothetical protein